MVELPRGFDGKRKQKYETFHGPRTEAQKRMNQLLAEVQSEKHTEPAHFTVKTYLEKWLKDYAKPSVAATTYERYEGIIRCNIIPWIGGIKLSKLTPLRLQSFESELLNSGRVKPKEDNKGLSPKTVIQVHLILHRAFVQAIKWGILARNPADGVSLPRVTRHQVTVLTLEESLKLLDAAAKTQYFFAPVLLCLATGMRRGEVLALKWSDINMEIGTVSINKSLEETTEHGIRLKDTKSVNGIRVVRLPKWAIAELKWWKAQQAKNKLLLG